MNASGIEIRTVGSLVRERMGTGFADCDHVLVQRDRRDATHWRIRRLHDALLASYPVGSLRALAKRAGG